MDKRRFLEDFVWAREKLGLCPNRLWATAREKLPEFLPKNEILAPGPVSVVKSSKDHKSCSFDFCEQSQRDFTSVTQRHECSGPEQCKTISGLFPRILLRKAAEKNQSTVWALDGNALLEPPKPYMAISHVWSDGTGAGAGARPGEVNRCLYAYFREYAERFGCEGIWWDTICIPHEKDAREKDAREKAMRMTQTNFQKARVTLVHDCFLRDWDWNPRTACFGILMSPWFSRGWTALDLAKSRKVKVIFKGRCGPVVKDLDEEILAPREAKSASDHSPHYFASRIIGHLRRKITNLNDLLTIMSSRFTSEPKDMATIAAFLSKCSRDNSQQVTFKNILMAFEKLAAGHLFHNSATMSDGFRWCPTDLFKMPLDFSTACLVITEYGDVKGDWRMFCLGKETVDQVKANLLWDHTHPIVRYKLEDALERHRTDQDCLLLAETGKSVAKRALLARRVKGADETIHCDLIGALYFARDVETCMWETSTVILVGSTDRDKSPTPFAGGREHLERVDSLHDAVRMGIVDEFPWLLVDEKNVTDVLGQLPLHLAAERGDDRMVKSLLDLSKEKLSREAACQTACCHGQTPLHRAAWGGSVSVARRLLSTESRSLMSRDNDGNTPLHIAARMGSARVVCLFINHSPQATSSTDRGNKNGQTPLHYAAMDGDHEVASLLINAGSNVASRDKLRWTPLHYAAGSGNKELVKLLTVKSMEQAHPKSGEAIGGWQPLHVAAICGQFGAFDYLSQAMPQSDTSDKRRWRPIHFLEVNHQTTVARSTAPDKNANTILKKKSLGPFHCLALNTQQGQFRTFVDKYLECLDTSSDKVTTDWSPHIFAVRQGLESTMQKFIKYNIDKIKSNGGIMELLLKEAIRYRQIGMTQLLLARLPESNPTDLLLFVANQDKPDTAIAAVMLDAGARINALGASPPDDFENSHHKSALHMATIRESVSMVALLLERGADVNVRSQYDQETPLHLATNMVIAEMLIDGGADVHGVASGHYTPLARAAGHGHMDLAMVLLRRGARKEITGKIPCIPALHLASEFGRDAMVLMLLQNEANVDGLDENRFTALHIAAENGHQTVVEILLRWNADINNAENLGKEKPIHLAAKGGSDGVIKMLLAKDPELVRNQAGGGQTPLHLAAERGSYAVAQLLLDRRADPNARDKHGNTPLVYAVISANSRAIVELLLEKGADPHAENEVGRTPLDKFPDDYKDLKQQWSKKISRRPGSRHCRNSAGQRTGRRNES